MLHPKKTTNVNYQLPQATTRHNMIKSYQKDSIELDFRFYVLLCGKYFTTFFFFKFLEVAVNGCFNVDLKYLSELHKDLLYVS